MKKVKTSKSDYEIKVYNIAGDLIFNQELRAKYSNQINLPIKTKGIYCIKIFVDDYGGVGKVFVLE